MDFPILIIWMNPLSFLGASGVFFLFLFHFLMKIKIANRKAPYRVLRRHIWGYSVCYFNQDFLNYIGEVINAVTY